MTTATEPPKDPAQKEALETEAGELQADIKEAKEEAKEARADGDDARAARLEASIAKTQADLEEIKGLIKGITDRPFAPAPGDGEPAPDAQGRTGDGAAEKDAAPETDDAKQPKKKHWLYGDRWNQD